MFLGRLFTSVALSLAVASSIAAVPSLHARDVATSELSYYPPLGALNPLAASVLTSKHAKRMTNAERMARGLPPNAPKRRAPGQLRARTSPTPTSDSSSSAPTSASSAPTSDSSTPTPTPTSASDSSSSSSASASSSPTVSSDSSTPSATPTCSSVMGRIGVSYKDADGFSQGGWVAAAASNFGEYAFTSDGNAALIMTYEVCGTQDPNEPTLVSLTSTNGLPNFPIVAAISGFANTNNDLGPGSFNYAYVGGASGEVPAGPAQVTPNSFSAAAGVPKGVETTIWSIGPGNHPSITPVWVNSDGTVANAQMAYVPSSDAFALLGDLDEFQSQFGEAYATSFAWVTGFQK